MGFWALGRHLPEGDGGSGEWPRLQGARHRCDPLFLWRHPCASPAPAVAHMCTGTEGASPSWWAQDPPPSLEPPTSRGCREGEGRQPPCCAAAPSPVMSAPGSTVGSPRGLAHLGTPLFSFAQSLHGEGVPGGSFPSPPLPHCPLQRSRQPDGRGRPRRLPGKGAPAACPRPAPTPQQRSDLKGGSARSVSPSPSSPGSPGRSSEGPA